MEVERVRATPATYSFYKRTIFVVAFLGCLLPVYITQSYFASGKNEQVRDPVSPLARLNISKGTADPKSQDPARERIDALTGALVDPTVIVISHTVIDYNTAAKQFANNGILQHFVIRTGGEIVQFVPVDRRAWHAGVAFWGRIGPGGRIAGTDGVNDVNSHSIGITLVGNGCESEFNDVQYDSLLSLLSALRDQFNIDAFDIVGLGEVAHPPKRHVAPCVLFDWDRIEGYGSSFPSRKRIAAVEVGNAPGNVDILRREVGDMSVDWGYSVHDEEEGLEKRVENVLDRYIGVRNHEVDFPTAWRVLKQMIEFRKQETIAMESAQVAG